MKPIKVTEVDLVFGGKIDKLLPPYEEIPDEFKKGYTKWNDIFNDIFFGGIKIIDITPKDEIDTEEALRHIKAIIVSFTPKHEYKAAGCAYLFSEFFEDIIYEKLNN